MQGHLAHADLLWSGATFDRVGHFSFGQELALAIRDLDPVWFFSVLEKAKVWPPVHGLVLASILTVGGVHHELGIVPSLFGWAATIVLVGVLAMKSFQDSFLGTVAAVFAVALTSASPVFRLFGTDVMLEGLGTALSALCLLLFARAMDRSNSAQRWQHLAIALTVLFFTKYNYWLLCAATLVVVAAMSQRSPLASWRALRRYLNAASATAIRVSRDRFVAAGGALLLVVVVLYVLGPTAVMVFGSSVSLYPPHNLTTAAYACVFIALWRNWRSSRAAFDDFLSTRDQKLFYWHVLPVAISFLLPDRISTFLRFIGPFHVGGGGQSSFADGLHLYTAAFVEGFHSMPWLGWLVLALFVLGLLGYAKLSNYGRTVLVFALVCAFVVFLHPQKQGRFLTTWMFAVWIGSGIGLAQFVSFVLPRSLGLARWFAVAFLGTFLLTFAYRTDVPATAYWVAARSPQSVSDLTLTEAYLPLLDGQREFAVAASFGRSDLLSWTARERCQCRRIVEQPWIASFFPTREEARAGMASLIAETSAMTLVVIDAPLYRSDNQDPRFIQHRRAGFADALRQQTRFVRVRKILVPDHYASISIWERSCGTGLGENGDVT